MSSNKSISIIGGGWLGTELGRRLSKKNFKTLLTTTTHEKIGQGEPDYCFFDLNNYSESDLASFNSDYVLFNIPPSAKTKSSEGFAQKVITLLEKLHKENIQRFYFISSTSVYGPDQGSVNEDSPREPKTENGRQLVEIENYLSKNWPRSFVIRPSGLCGKNRNPARFFHQRTLKAPMDRVHFIHLFDLCEFIEKSFDYKTSEPININLNYPLHSNKMDFYQKLGSEFLLPDPLPEKGSREVHSKYFNETQCSLFDFNLKFAPDDLTHYSFSE